MNLKLKKRLQSFFRSISKVANDTPNLKTYKPICGDSQGLLDENIQKSKVIRRQIEAEPNASEETWLGH
jgi:hypothetical protein